MYVKKYNYCCPLNLFWNKKFKNFKQEELRPICGVLFRLFRISVPIHATMNVSNNVADQFPEDQFPEDQFPEDQVTEDPLVIFESLFSGYDAAIQSASDVNYANAEYFFDHGGGFSNLPTPPLRTFTDIQVSQSMIMLSGDPFILEEFNDELTAENAESEGMTILFEEDIETIPVNPPIISVHEADKWSEIIDHVNNHFAQAAWTAASATATTALSKQEHQTGK